jgi:nucleoside phosphorylase
MLAGRRGHTRVLVLTVTDSEREAVRAEFGADYVVQGAGRGLACWTPDVAEDNHFGVIVSQSMSRSNLPAGQSVQILIEDWRPEVLVVVGTAGGIARFDQHGGLDGPATGDVVCVEYVHYAEFAKYDAGRRNRRYFPIQHPDNLLLTAEVREVETSEDWHDGLIAPPAGSSGTPRVRIGELVALEVVAGDGHAQGQQDLLKDFDHAIAIDMESAGVARAMHTASDSVFYRPAWLAIRGISDLTAATSDVENLLSGNNDERQLWTPYAAAVAARFAHRIVERILARQREPFADPGAESWIPASQR